MSLKLWLPLDGNLNNYGASDKLTVTNHGATARSSGKIGKCYVFSGSSSSKYITSNYSISEFSANTTYSITAWVKISNDTSSTMAPIIGTYNYHWCIYYSNNTDIGFVCWDANGSHSNGLNGILYSGDDLRDVWHHIALTWDGNKVRFYLDGIKTSSELTLNPSGSTLTKNYDINIGGNIYAWGTNYRFVGVMNDVRIYDHCLSPDEAKEISKALVLHYPLNDPLLEPTTNLVTGLRSGGQTSVSSGVVTTSGVDKDTYFTINLSESIVTGTTYTLSCEAEGIPAGAYWSFPMGSQSNSSLTMRIYNGYNKYTFTANSIDWGTNQLFMDDTARSGAPVTKFYNFQLEKKDHATPYTPTSRDSLTVTDCSGYNRNGTVTSSTRPSVTDGSARNNLCYQFDGTDDYIVSSVKQGDILADKKFTISAWVYLTDFREARGILGPHESTGTKGICFCQCNGSSNKIICGFGNGSSWNNVQDDTGYSLNTWTLYTMTYDGDLTVRYAKMYKNGSYVGTSSTGNIAFADNPITIGRAYDGNDRYWKGKISDVKIYATVLSDDDIAQEYHRYAAIYNNHSFAVSEFIEDDKASLGTNGVLKGNLIEGDYSKVSILPSSGNIQATEFIEEI